MRRIKQRHAVLAVAILIALPLSSNSPEVVTANQSTQRERSAFCLNRTRPSAAALMSFAGYSFFSLGLPWELISTIGFPNNINNSLPLISGLPAPGPALPTPLAVQTIDVSVNNDFFAPATVRISVGDTVRWTWQGTSHTVVSGFCVAAVTNGYEGCTPNNNFCSPSNQNCGASPPLGPGAVYSHQFNSTGSYPYFCSVHGNLMQGTVIVEVGVAPTIQFSSPTYSVSEGAGAATRSPYRVVARQRALRR